VRRSLVLDAGAGCRASWRGRSDLSNAPPLALTAELHVVDGVPSFTFVAAKYTLEVGPHPPQPRGPGRHSAWHPAGRPPRAAVLLACTASAPVAASICVHRLCAFFTFGRPELHVVPLL
jgi:hypothetical protein